MAHHRTSPWTPVLGCGSHSCLLSAAEFDLAGLLDVSSYAARHLPLGAGGGAHQGHIGMALSPGEGVFASKMFVGSGVGAVCME